MSKMKLYGIQSINLNGVKVYTLNISINPSSLILNKIIEDPVWKNMHTIGMRNGKSKVTFTYTTLDQDEFYAYTKRLHNILFAHKVNKLMNENPFVDRKEQIIIDTLNQIDAEKDNFIL